MPRQGDDLRPRSGTHVRSDEAKSPTRVWAGSRRLAIAAFVAGASSATLAAMLAAFLYIEAGGFNVAAVVPHNAFTYWATNTAMPRSVKLRARDLRGPAGFSPL